MRSVLLAIALAVSSIGSVAIADHTLPAGSLARLQRDTYDLDRSVQYSTISYNVKRAVSRFAYDVNRFVACTGQREQRDHDLIPEHCEYVLDQVHYSWYPVERYLYDTNYDYPYIYYRYLNVRSDMHQLPH